MGIILPPVNTIFIHMARQTGFLKMSGFIDGLVFYERDGKFFVKRAGGADKNKILRSPNFARTRENMQEFGAAAEIGTAFRRGFAEIIELIRTTPLSGKVTGMMKNINRAGEGLRGARNFEILKNKQFIEGFELNQKVPLKSVFFASSTLPEVNEDRTAVDWLIPAFNARNFIRPPKDATHAQLVLHTVVLSDYIFDPAPSKYRYVHPEFNHAKATDYSEIFSLNGDTEKDILLQTRFGFPGPLPLTAGIVVGIGIIFMASARGSSSLIPGQNAMQVVLVG